MLLYILSLKFIVVFDLLVIMTSGHKEVSSYSSSFVQANGEAEESSSPFFYTMLIIHEPC
jgi:hypothetical protein